MIKFKTIRRGDRVAVWNTKGDVRFVDGPKRLILYRERIETLNRYRAQPHQYLFVRFLDGRTEHFRGPAKMWLNPIENESIAVKLEAKPKS